MSDKKLDYAKVKQFWDNRASRRSITGELYVANLSDNIPLQGIYKDKLEKEFIARNIFFRNDMTVLDLGCGSGRMSFFFAQFCKRVIAVDFSDSLLALARARASADNIANIQFICRSICEFQPPDQRFDIIFLGGVLSYLNDNDAMVVLRNCKQFLLPQGVLIVRESLAHRVKLILTDTYKPALQDNYSVAYRNIREFKMYFSGESFALIHETNLACFPFLGLYHAMIRTAFGQASLFEKLSKLYFSIFYPLVPLANWFKMTFLYEGVAWCLNKYEQKIFIFKRIQ